MAYFLFQIFLIILLIGIILYLKNNNIENEEELTKKNNEIKKKEFDLKNKEEEKKKEIDRQLQQIKIKNNEINEKQKGFIAKEKEIEIREKEIKAKEEEIIQKIKIYEENKLKIDKQQKEIYDKSNKINIKEIELQKQQKELYDKSNSLNIKEKDIENKEKEIEKMTYEISEKIKEFDIKEKDIQNKNIEILEKQKQLEIFSDELHRKQNIIQQNEKNNNQIIPEIKNENEYEDKDDDDDNLYENYILKTDDNKFIEESKNKIFLNPEKYNQINQELNDYKNKNIELANYNNQLEMKIKTLEEKLKNGKKDELEVIEDELIDESNIIEEKSKIEDIKKILEEKVTDLHGLSKLTNEDLKSKVISMKKVLDLLYKKLEESDHRKFEYENKLIRLQNTFNEQLELDRQEILRLYKSKKKWKNMESSFLSTGEPAFNMNNLKEGKNDEDKVKNRISLLYKENKSLKYVAKDLKKKIKELKKNDG